MNVNFNFEDALYEIQEEIARIPKSIQGNSKKYMQNAAKILKKNVEANLPKSDLDAEATNYDGTPYVHMKDDVKTSVKDDNAGSVYAIIRGGKYTGYKWHLVNNGHVDKSENIVKGTHFVDKALEQSESDIDTMVDKLIQEALNG